MRKQGSVYTLFMFLIGAMLLLNSCVRPDLSDCPTQSVRIRIKTHTETSRAGESDASGIENMTIYVFDADYRFVQAWKGPAYIYGQVYEARLDLPPATYHFVVWTNEGELYSSSHSISQCLAEVPTLYDLTFSMACPADSKITGDLPLLHHGMLTGAEVIADVHNVFDVTLIPNTYKLNFSVEGLTVCDDEYNFSVKDNNSRYTFDNFILDNQEEFEYLRTARFEEDQLTARMNVLKLTPDRDPVFTLTDATENKSLFSKGVISMIKKAYMAGGQPVDFSKTFEFDIIVSFNGDPSGTLGIAISVNGWIYMENSTHL